MVLLMFGCMNAEKAPDASGMEVQISVTDPLPDDAAFVVYVAVDPGFRLSPNLRAMAGTMAPEETLWVERAPGDWKVSAEFGWNDPSKEGKRDDTGAYIGTWCSAEEEVTVGRQETVKVLLPIGCSDEWTD
jgi:hypothetical protein